MKKLNILIALALCVIVGGVYATWTYATKAPVAQEQKISVAITDKVNTEKGAISVTDNGLTITVGNAGNYKAEVRVEGSLTVKFDPAEGVDTGIATNGIKLVFTIAAPDKQYLSAPIFTTEPTTEYDIENSGISGLEYTITSTQVKNAIKIAEITLDAESEYDDFYNALSGAQFTITVKAKTLA